MSSIQSVNQGYSGFAGNPVAPNQTVRDKPSDAVKQQVSAAETLKESAKADASKDELKAAVTAANKSIQSLRSSLQFAVDDATGVSVVKFVDTQTKEVIRQIPSEDMLAIAKRLDELRGIFVKENA